MNAFQRRLAVLPIALVAFACSKGADQPKQVDSALNSDLSLAQQAHPYTPADSISAAERASAPANAYTSRAPAPRTRTIVEHVYVPAHRTYGSSAASGGTYRRGPVDRVVKHTGRDAAIGAGAGAVIGAVTSHDKVKGGLIGAAAGGLLGAVIGNNVDKKKVPVP